MSLKIAGAHDYWVVLDVCYMYPRCVGQLSKTCWIVLKIYALSEAPY